MKIKVPGLTLFLSMSMLAITQIVLAAPIDRLYTPIGFAAPDRSLLDPAGPVRSAQSITYYAYLPLVSTPDFCAPTGETYSTLSTINTYGGDASTHPDLNLAVRGYVPTTTPPLSLVNYAGAIDPDAPQLYTLFEDNRTPIFNAAYQVYKWDWDCNCRTRLIAKWPVTLLGMQMEPGEIIHAPIAKYDIGGGYGLMVLYAEESRLTLKYTRDDDVVSGYTIHLENICVDPNLLALYQQSNASGRVELPVLFPGQPLGRSPGTEIDVAVRDGGSLLDPRSRKDWWQGR